MIDDDDLLEVDEPTPPEADDDDQPPEAEPDEAAEVEEEQPPRNKRRERTEKRFARLTHDLNALRRENEALKTRVSEREREAATRDLTEYTNKKADLKRQLKDAREAGDTDAEIEIEDQLRSVDHRLESVKIYVENFERGRHAPAEKQETAAPPSDEIPLTPEEASRANERINAWAEDADFRDWDQAEKDAAIAIERMVACKHKRGTDTFYRQVAARLKASIPARAQEIDYATRRQVRGKPRPSYDEDEGDNPEPISRAGSQMVRRASVPPSADDGGGDGERLPRLTAAQLRDMERIHLDPNNKEHRAHWARSLRKHGQI